MTATAESVQPKWQVYGVYVLCALLTVGVGFSGVQKLMGAETWLEQFTNFGYPIWFMYLIGVLQTVGAIGLWIPKTRLLSAALYVVIMLGAAASNLMVGNVGFVVPNLVLILIAALVAWMSRNAWPLARS